MQALMQKLKDKETYKYLICLCGFIAMIIMSMNYTNAGVNYEQQIGIRPFCIVFGIVVLALMPVKTWINIWTIIYIPVCYAATHYLYNNQLIYDACKYEHIDVIRMGKLVALIYGVAIISVIVDLIKNKTYKELMTGNRITSCLWLVFCVVLAFTIGQYYYSWYIIVAFCLAFYLLRKSETRELVISAAKTAFILSFVYITIRAMLHRPFYTGRYTSFFVNYNICGMFYACTNISIYVTICSWWNKKSEDEKDRKKKAAALIGLYILMGISAALTLFNFTRTTILGQIFAMFVLLVVRIIRKDSIKSAIARLGAVLLATAIMFYPVYLGIRYIPPIVDEPISLAWEDLQGRHIGKGEPIDSWKYITLKEWCTTAFEKLGITVDFHTTHVQKDSAQNTETGNVDVVNENGSDAGYEITESTGDVSVQFNDETDISNGRFTIWKKYFGLLSIKGHYPPEIIMENGQEVFHAHNTYLHLSYMYGLIFGVLYIIQIGLALLFAMISYIKKCEPTNSNLFVLLLLGTSAMAQMTESIFHPCNFFCFFTYLSIVFVANISTRKVEKEKEA